jgi:hypothetical protein
MVSSHLGRTLALVTVAVVIGFLTGQLSASDGWYFIPSSL